MDPNQTIGAKIKALRTEKKYTLKNLGDLTGFSVGFLSQIERGISSVAVDSLAKIAKCLEVPLSTFFDTEPPDRQDPVVHSFSTHQTMVSPQIIQSILSHDTQAFDFLPQRFLLMPFSDPDTLVPELYAHTGEEFIYVLTGIVSLWVENSRYTLYPGDSVQIHSNQPHNWANNTNKVAELLSINYPNPLRSDTAGHML
ncbi:MAG: cupin domain-containing protein [Oscillospiraceae bacterium]|nr:cupin domain-containing protein [Oscillospiraceae bacterium]